MNGITNIQEILLQQHNLVSNIRLETYHGDNYFHCPPPLPKLDPPSVKWGRKRRTVFRLEIQIVAMIVLVIVHYCRWCIFKWFPMHGKILMARQASCAKTLYFRYEVMMDIPSIYNLHSILSVPINQQTMSFIENIIYFKYNMRIL